MSYYLNPVNFENRLRAEWEVHGGLIIAVDVDSTLIPFWEEEKPYDSEAIRQLVRDCKANGCTIIINTAAREERLEQMKIDLRNYNIPWDYFNESPPFIKDIGKGAKVYANAYLDDRGGLYQVYNTLRTLLYERWVAKTFQAADELARSIGHEFPQL